MNFDQKKSIEELEKTVWPHDPFESHVVQESQKLRKVPVEKLTNENIRLLILQKIGLSYIVPVAIERLVNNPLASGELYQGDLLSAIANISQEFWHSYPELNNAVVELAQVVAEAAETLAECNKLLESRSYV